MVNVSRLEVGKVYKNYKELCSVLDTNIMNGNSKKSQLNEWSRYFAYDRKGHKFIINEIYKYPLDKIDNRVMSGNVAPYMKEMEVLILDLLAQDQHDGLVSISKNKLLNELKMINDNYNTYNYRRLKLSELINIDISNINDFYNSSNSTFKSNVETALKRLTNQSLIYWNYSITVCHAIPKVEYTENGNVKMKKKTIVNENGDYEYTLQVSEVTGEMKHREAEKDEIRIIKEVERDILTRVYGCESISQVFGKGKIKEFYSKVNDVLFDRLNILYYYNSYTIIFNRDNVNKKLSDLILNGDEKSIYHVKLNSKVMNRLNENAVKRKEKTELDTLLVESLSNKEIQRTNDNYTKDISTLNMKLIKYNSKFGQDKVLNSTYNMSNSCPKNKEVIKNIDELLPF